MTTTTTLAELMRDLAEDFEMNTNFASEIEGTYAIPLEENLLINISSQYQGILLSCNLAPVPPMNRENIFQHMLHGNLFGQGTHGGVLGSTLDGNILTLSRDVEYTPGYNEFKDLVEDFISMVDYWRGEILKPPGKA